MPVGRPNLGRNTAKPANVAYRVGRIAPYLSGRWLDFGCAEGGYTSALLDNGAKSVVGVDVEQDRINAAMALQIPNASFLAFGGSRLDFPDGSFDGALVNEVLEHVADEQESLREILSVLKPGGSVLIIAEAYRGSKLDFLLALPMKLIGAAYLSSDELRDLLIQAGFSDAQVFTQPIKGWICAAAA